MKRLLYIMFACACALFTFVSNAEAQATGDIVTIKTRNGNNYLAADANGTIYNCTSVNDDCYWLVTRSGNYTYRYTFQSLSSGKYLHAERTWSGNSYYTLNLGTASPFTFSGNKLSASNCYVSYNNNWVGASSGTDLTIDVIEDFTRQFIDVDPADESELEELTTITLTAKTGVVIDNDSFTKNSFTLTDPTDASASISNVTANGNVLTIKVANGDNEGDYELSFSKDDIKDRYGISFEAATYSWKVSSPLYKFTSVTPKTGNAGAFSVITLNADVAIKQVLTSGFTLDGTKTIGNGLTVALSDDKKQLTITSNTILNEGEHTLSITKGAVVAEDGIAFAAATYKWTVVPPQFIDVTPAEGTTDGFNTITLTASADIEETLRFGFYNPDNNKKVNFTLTRDGSEVAKSDASSGVGLKRIDDRTLQVIIPDNLGVGTYRLEIQQGAIQSSDGRNFPTATYTWTVNAHQFGKVLPATVEVGDHLEQITIPAADPTVVMSIPHDPDLIGQWVELKNAGGATIPTTVAIVDNKLVITPVAALGNGVYSLTVKKGAVVGPHSVPFAETSKTWNVVVSVSITHVNGFYSTLGDRGYQNVHTVERTIYYIGNETSVPLTLAETNFFGYMRWYDYTTDSGTNITWTTQPSGSGGDFEEIVGTGTHLGWFGWNRSNTTGNPVANGGKGGVLNNTENSNITPTINISGWTGSHTIACDVSHYLDYTITRVNDNIVGITEPRLSYRQLFHFKPASEMATRVDACTGDTYLETYYYTAPTNTNVYLTTAYHHSMSDATENNYFYNKTNPTRIPASNLSWYKDGGEIADNYVKEQAQWGGSSTILQDFQTVTSASTGEVTYTLRATIGTNTYNIAKFVVNYVDKNTYGPVKETGTNGSAKAIISYNEMNKLFEVLEYNDFNYGQKKEDGAQHFLTTPLPWDQSTYGFSSFAKGEAILPNEQYNVPYYGEYSIVNYVSAQYWEKSANHVDGITNEDQAAKQGYAIYVDGTTEPGVVASISTQVTICAERTMYCSVWLRCPRPSDDGSKKPIFRCNVQGRNRLSDGTYTPWEDVAVYFAGEVTYSSKWQQVNFPIESQETYSECRVRIYNFGTGGNGNDFLLDDLCIYADKLPMSSYQLQTEMCCSPDHDGTTFTAAVLRVDYGTTTLVDDSYQYYQIYNKTTKKPLKLTTASLSPYYHEDTQSAAPEGLTKEEYGSIKVRHHEFDPNTEEGAKICTPGYLVGELLESYNTDNTKPLWGKCYVAKTEAEKQSTPGNYYMYIVHIIPNIHDNRVQENYLQEHCQYTLRMTSEASDLRDTTLSCAVEIDLPATQQSLYRLMSSQIETSELLCNSANNCPNELYTLEAFIRKDSDPYSDAGEAEGTYLADWMYGHAFDEVYRMDYPHENDSLEHLAKDTADIKFAEVYRCSRAQVTDAFLDLRRVPTPAIDTIPADPNPNYYAMTFDSISPLYFSDYRQDADTPSVHYETIKYLHNQGWLQLATSSASFYLGSQDTARYWVFPIENSAVATDGVTPLHDCPEPRWVQVSSTHSNHYINIAPGIDIASNQVSDPRTGVRVPNVRVLARMVNNTIQIPIHQSSQGDYDVHFMGADASIFVTNDDKIKDPHEVKYTSARSGNVITLLPAAGNNATLEIGKEYTMSIRMRDKDDQHRAADENCDVGKIYVKLLILPDVVKWTPTTPDKSWHNDANWTGYGTGMENYHYAPIAGSNVIIPTARYPELTVIANTDEDPHPYPMDANFALAPTCGQIYFEPGAMMLNQHLLQHEKALVDLKVRNMYWNTVAVPISSVVSGDMYIPHSGDENKDTLVSESEPFTVGTFQGSRHSTSALPFWMSVYNRTVERINENPAQNGTRISTNTAAFATTNSLNYPFEVGSGYQLLGWAAENMGLDSLIVRLPKPDNVYSYYDSEGYLADNVAINRGDNPNKLTYSPDVPITLTNERTSKSFMFGNPTMAMIDLTKCLPDGATIYKMVNDSWCSGTKVSLEMDKEYRYLEPMRSVLVEFPTPGTSKQIDLKAEHLITPEKIKAGNDATHGLAPRRNTGSSELQLMTIYADSYGTKARCLLGAKPGMRDVYSVGEDAIFISSGVEAEVNSATATSPVNMYTIAKQVPLMVDVRENIDTVPLALLIQDIYRTPTIIFSFNLTDNWDKECYLWDSKTDDRFLITDSLVLELEMSLNHETRYFILGPDDTTNDGVSSSTDRPVLPQVDTPIQLWAYSAQSGQLQVNSNEIIQHVKVYDLTGRLVAQQALDLYGHSMTLSVPTGMCIVEATMRDNTTHYTQAIVR